MIAKTLSKELNINSWQSEATIELINEGNTIPFIARYRKELTGSLDDETLRIFDERFKYLLNLEDRKETIIGSISEQGKLTKELERKINDTLTLVALEDIYRPYKPKKRTRAIIAKEKGLGPLAKLIINQKTKIPIEDIAKDYLSPENDLNEINDVISGAKDIIAENISDNSDFRKLIRKITFDEGNLEVSTKDKKLDSSYEMYYEYTEQVKKIAPHRILAINRGEKEKILKVKLKAPEDEIISYLNRKVLINHSNNIKIKKYNKFTKNILEEAVSDSYKRLIATSIEREIRSFLTEKAEKKSIKVFTKNLEQLLMQGPILNKTVLGWDPGFRTGCKLAVVDEFGNVLDTVVVFPTDPQNEIVKTKKIVKTMIDKYGIDLIALGNGTASRESEIIIADIIKGTNVEYVIVNEAGASVYSASKLASEEFPDFDVGERSATSIARRLQDPLAELVKIDPKSIGVGQYQHDMNQKQLNDSLKGIVEKSVNEVGVDLNTASFALLNYVSGVTKTISKNIIKYREEKGSFTSRKELLKVSKLGPKAFEQSSGFLKVLNSENPLDNTTVHPESYTATLKLLKSLNYHLEDIGNKNMNFNNINYEKLAIDLDIGEITLKDIVNQLKKPGRDPRDEMPQPILKSDVLAIEDLEEGMIMEGTVRNVVDFGAFVDIGVHQDGLVHISEIAENKFVKHPLDFVSVGDIVEVKIVSIDISKKRIQLSMII